MKTCKDCSNYWVCNRNYANEIPCREFEEGAPVGKFTIIHTVSCYTDMSETTIKSTCDKCRFAKVTKGAAKTYSYTCSNPDSPARNRHVTACDYCRLWEKNNSTF